MPMDNEERADHAAEGVAAYLRSKGEYDSDKPIEGFVEEYEISDLICDLLHLSDRLGFETGLQFYRAEMHYGAERDEGG